MSLGFQGTCTDYGRFLGDGRSNIQEHSMDKDRVKGAANQAKGKIKEVAGNVTGDAKLQTEGVADQVKGKVQSAVGGAKDALKK
jgi:uncharacterized protein YjbJ (UPF0337 family)